MSPFCALLSRPKRRRISADSQWRDHGNNSTPRNPSTAHPAPIFLAPYTFATLPRPIFLPPFPFSSPPPAIGPPPPRRSSSTPLPQTQHPLLSTTFIPVSPCS